MLLAQTKETQLIMLLVGAKENPFSNWKIALIKKFSISCTDLRMGKNVFKQTSRSCATRYKLLIFDVYKRN